MKSIKVTDSQKEIIDKLRILRPDIGDVGKNVYEKTVYLVMGEVLDKAAKYDELTNNK